MEESGKLGEGKACKLVVGVVGSGTLGVGEGRGEGEGEGEGMWGLEGVVMSICRASLVVVVEMGSGRVVVVRVMVVVEKGSGRVSWEVEERSRSSGWRRFQMGG